MIRSAVKMVQKHQNNSDYSDVMSLDSILIFLYFVSSLPNSSLLINTAGGVCGVTSLCLDQEQPPERTKLDDPHVLSGTYVRTYSIMMYVFLNSLFRCGHTLHHS